MNGLHPASLPRQLGFSLLCIAAVALKTRVAYFHGVVRAEDDPLRYWAAIAGWLGIGTFLCIGSLFAD